MIPDDIIKLLENAGFIVTNKDDFSKIEIRDSKNNNELVKRYFSDSPTFYGSNGRDVCLWSNYIEINLGKGIDITKYNPNISKCKYEIRYMQDKKIWCEIEIECVFANEKNAGSISVKIDTYEHVKGSYSLGIIQKPLNTAFYYNGSSCTPLDIENCNTKLYLEKIAEFLCQNDFISRYFETQEAVKIVLPSVSDDIEKMFTSYIENIDKYIKTLENEKEENPTKMNIDADIERLRKISENRQIVKKQNI